MDLRKIEATLKDHEKRLKKLEGKATKEPTSKTKKNTPTFMIMTLYKEGFFRKERTLGEITAKLKLKGIHLTEPVIYVTLSRADYLTRTGRKGKYKFVQKYPPN